MTNREYYSEKLLDIACTGASIALQNGKPCICRPYECNKCDCREENGCAEDFLKKWSEQEYIEEPVDWGSVEVDTPVLVKNTKEATWQKRRFAFYLNGTVYTWQHNMTSKETNKVLWWNYSKLDIEA